jgi:hypothetical protein
LTAPDFVDQTSDIVKITDDSGLEEVTSVKWNLFPNPAKNVLNVTIQDGQAQEWVLLDVYGKTISHQLIQGNEVQLNTENLSIGTYFMHVQFENGSRSVKSFVKQ